MAIQVLMQPAPLLHKLDNVVHEDEYLAPKVFQHVAELYMAGSQVDPQTEKLNNV